MVTINTSVLLKRRIDYVNNIKDMSQRSFIFTEICLATVLSEPFSLTLQGKPEHTENVCVLSWMLGKKTLAEKL